VLPLKHISIFQFDLDNPLLRAKQVYAEKKNQCPETLLYNTSIIILITFNHKHTFDYIFYINKINKSRVIFGFQNIIFLVVKYLLTIQPSPLIPKQK